MSIFEPLANKQKSPFITEDDVLQNCETSARPGQEHLQFGDACVCHLQVLQILRIPPRVTRAAHTSNDTAVAALDVLLAFNKQSVVRCSTMLDCKDCFGGGTSFLLVLTLLSQILALYYSASKSYLAHTVPTSGRDAGETSIVPGPLRLNFGAYKLDKEDEMLLKKELMLIELRKVESLLSRFRKVVGELDDRTESGAYEAFDENIVESSFTFLIGEGIL
ncbi:MAG: hypothetical protein Q9195_006565 [Heterodermia aff. obscurata]